MSVRHVFVQDRVRGNTNECPHEGRSTSVCVRATSFSYKLLFERVLSNLDSDLEHLLSHVVDHKKRNVWKNVTLDLSELSFLSASV